VRSENRSQEKVIEPGSSTGESGVPGVRSNVPNDSALTGKSGPKEAKRKNETLNYEMNRKVSKIIEPTGAIKRLSIAVLVDGTYEAGEGAEGQTEDGAGAKQYVPRSEQEIDKLTLIVKKAVGFSEERGDQIEMVNVPFDIPAVPEGEDGMTAGVQSFLGAWGGFLKPVLFFFLGAMVLLFVIRPMALNLSKPSAAVVALPQAGLPATVSEYEAQISETPQDQALKLASDNPATAAQVIRTWIKEEQEEKV
jgi:flagellar M-ring protein FliF